MTVKHIAIYCVNYHSYDSLEKYLQSIDRAVEKSQEPLTLSVFVADNSVPCTPVGYEPRHFSLRVLPTGENKGYFGAIQYLMRQMSPLEYDYCIVSNVDVLLDDAFFTNLCTCEPDEMVGWIAPEIYSRIERRDRNPKILQRYPRRKLQILKTLFRIPPLYNLYTHTVYKSKKLLHHEAGPIYAGHGSFIILTQQYFRLCGIIDYPVFLFCEEIYLGEQCRLHQLKVIYDPTIRVTDAEHASTSTIRRSKYCEYNFQAISHILETYYK